MTPSFQRPGTSNAILGFELDWGNLKHNQRQREKGSSVVRFRSLA
jgi:hypothetical protein